MIYLWFKTTKDELLKTLCILLPIGKSAAVFVAFCCETVVPVKKEFILHKFNEFAIPFSEYIQMKLAVLNCYVRIKL